MAINVEIVPPPGTRNPGFSGWFYIYHRISKDALWDLFAKRLKELNDQEGAELVADKDKWNLVPDDERAYDEANGTVLPNGSWKAYPLDDAFSFYERV